MNLNSESYDRMTAQVPGRFAATERIPVSSQAEQPNTLSIMGTAAIVESVSLRQLLIQVKESGGHADAVDPG